VRKERRERRVEAPVTGHRPGSRSFSFCRSPPQPRLSVLRFLGVAPGCQPNFSLEGRITASFFALDHMPVRSISVVRTHPFLGMLYAIISRFSSRTLPASDTAVPTLLHARRC
jgi:hypothetical protein